MAGFSSTSCELRLQRVEPLWPQARIALDPPGDLVEGTGHETVEAPGSHGPGLDDLGLSQQPQLIRDGGLPDAELDHDDLADLAGGALTIGEHLDDASTHGIGENGELAHVTHNIIC